METAAEIEALLVQSVDDLFAEIIFPNYGKVTSDGVTLGPTWWSERDALLAEVRWLRNALDLTESGLNAGSPVLEVKDQAERSTAAIQRSLEDMVLAVVKARRDTRKP